MNGSRIAVAVAAAAAIALPAGPALATTTGHSMSTHATKNTPVIVSCDRKLQVRPKSYVLACGDGSQWLSRLRWSSWTAGEATASGRFTFNTCTPNCAEGKFITSPVVVVLWHPAAIPHYPGQRAFLMMTAVYTGKRPAHSSRTFTERLWYPVIG